MIRLVTDTADESANRKSDYTLRILLDVAGVSARNDLTVSYGANPDPRCDAWIPRGTADKQKRTNAIAIDHDIIAESFDLLSCAEEYGSRRDDKGRFLAAYSTRDKLDVPIVNRNAIALKEALAKAARGKNRTLVVESRRFTVVLSHDVDNITDKNIHVVLHRLSRALKYLLRGRIAQALRMGSFTVGRLVARGNPYRNYADYIELERRYGFRSTFFMITGSKGRFGARYSIAGAREMLTDIAAAGWEVALHVNFDSFRDPAAIAREKRAFEEVIGASISGCRNHYLMFSLPESWHAIRQAGLRYDSSIGYTDAIGFRAGIAYPYRPYDRSADRDIDLIELPLVIMDTAVMDYDHDIEASWVRIKKVLDETRAVGGTISVNFHHRVLYEREFPGWRNMYVRILDYIREHGGRGIPASTLVEEGIVND